MVRLCYFFHVQRSVPSRTKAHDLLLLPPLLRYLPSLQLESALPESHASRRPPSLYPMAPPPSVPSNRDTRRSSGTSNSDETTTTNSPSTSTSPSSSSSRDRRKDGDGSGGRVKKRVAAPDWEDGLSKVKGKGKERGRSEGGEEGSSERAGGGNKLDAIRSAWPSADPKVLLALEKSALKSKSRDKGEGKEVARKGSVGGVRDGKAEPWTSDWWERVRSNSASGPASTLVCSTYQPSSLSHVLEPSLTRSFSPSSLLQVSNPSSSRPAAPPSPNNPFPSATPPQGYPVSHPLYNNSDAGPLQLPNRNPPPSQVWTIPFPPLLLSPSSPSSRPQPTYDPVSSWGGPGGFLAPEGGEEGGAERDRARKEWGRGLVVSSAVSLRQTRRSRRPLERKGRLRLISFSLNSAGCCICDRRGPS